MDWTEEHIVYNKNLKKYIAYDEAGMEYGRYYTKEAAQIDLRRYGEWLEREYDNEVKFKNK